MRARVEILFVWHKKYGFQIAIKMPVHLSHLKFILKVRNGPQASDQNACSFFPRVINQETVEGFDGGVRVSPGFADERKRVSASKAGCLAELSNRNGNDHPVKKTASSGQGVQVPVGDWIEGSGIQRNTHSCA